MMRSLETQPKLQLLRLLGRIAGSQDLEAKVACGGWGARRLVLGNLAEGHVRKDPGIFHTAEVDGGFYRPLCRSSRLQTQNVFRTSQRTVPIRLLAPSGFPATRGISHPQNPHTLSTHAAVQSKCSNTSVTIQSSQPSSGPHPSPHAVPFAKPRGLLETLKHSSPQLRSNKHDAHLGDRSKAVGHIGEFQSSGW